MPCRYDLKKKYDLPQTMNQMNKTILIVIISVLNVLVSSGPGWPLGNPSGTSLSIYKNLFFLTFKHSFYLLDLV